MGIWLLDLNNFGLYLNKTVKMLVAMCFMPFLNNGPYFTIYIPFALVYSPPGL
jgi:hypothetical protein